MRRLTIIALIAAIASVVMAGTTTVINLQQIQRVDNVALDACEGAQRVRQVTNRNGAIIYVVLKGAAGRHPDRGYDDLLELPQYQDPVNCERAVADPSTYFPGEPTAYAQLDKKTLMSILRDGKR